jgi:hypothetical protein
MLAATFSGYEYAYRQGKKPLDTSLWQLLPHHGILPSWQQTFGGLDRERRMLLLHTPAGSVARN